MLKWIHDNIDLSIKYSLYYLIVSFLLFIIIGIEDYPAITERILIAFAICIGYIISFYIFRLYLKMQKKIQKHHWEKFKKFLKLQANIIIIGGIVITVFILLYALFDIKTLLLQLIASNITIGIALGAIKAKIIYLKD